MELETRNIDELIINERNPRGIKTEDFERLKRQVEKLGVYKPIIIDKNNKVLGGNMRVRAYKELGLNTVWVSVVDTKEGQLELDYMLSDNDEVGYWEEQDLAELITEAEGLDLELYKVDVGQPIDLSKFLDQTTGKPPYENNPDEETKEVTCPNCGHTFRP